jgi:hypothetical protein
MKKFNVMPLIKKPIEFCRKYPTLVTLIVFAILFFFIHLGWQDTIEYGYDPGRLSQMVVDILDRHDLINTPQYILDNIGPGAVAWGPIFIYVMIPFFLITRNPLIITDMLIVLQFIGIIATYLSVELLYNKRVAFFSTIFIIVFPWYVIFSRMLYNPSMLLWSIPLVIYVTLLIVKKGKQKLLFVLPALWFIMIQFHFVGLVILALSLVYLIVHFKKVVWKYFRIGLLFGIIPLLPILAFDINHNFKFTFGVLAAKKAPKDPNNDPGEVVRNVLQKTPDYMLLTDVENHLGYASNDFFNRLPFAYDLFHYFYTIVFVMSIVFFFIKIFWKPKADDVFVFFWFLSVTIFLIAFNFNSSKNVVITQRYFIPVFYPIGIMIGYTIDKITLLVFDRLRSGKKFPSNPIESALSRIEFGRNFDADRALTITTCIASFVFVFFFSMFMITYYTFIETYGYPHEGFFGWLSYDSGPPYASQYDAIQYALADAKKDGFDSIVISYNWNVEDKFNMSGTEEYIWKYVLKRKIDYSPSLPYYFISPLDPPIEIPRDNIKKFGAFKVYRKRNARGYTANELSVGANTKAFGLISVGSGKCVDVANGSSENGTRFIQWDFHAQPNQGFHLIDSDEPGYFYIETELGRKFMEIKADNSVAIESKSNSGSQKWKLDTVGPYLRIVSRQNGKALSVQNGSRDNGAAIVAEPADTGQEQLWKVVYY